MKEEENKWIETLENKNACAAWFRKERHRKSSVVGIRMHDRARVLADTRYAKRIKRVKVNINTK